jgi:molybdenum cofactor biosynthesis protein B
MNDVTQPPGGGKMDLTIAFRALRVAVLTVSDTRDAESDTSGKLLADRVLRDGHVLAARAMVKDDVGQIQAQLKDWIADAGVDVVVSTGGTGLTGRDVTPEAMRPLFDKAIEGFETVWHMTSFQTVGLSTMQSRACAGLAKGDLDLRASRFERRLQGWLGPHPPLAARQPPSSLQSGGTDRPLHGNLNEQRPHPSGSKWSGPHGRCRRQTRDAA